MKPIVNQSSESRNLRGTKRICLKEECGGRFYDLRKEPATCPYCGEIFIPKPVVIIEPRAYRKTPRYDLVKPPPVNQLEDTDEEETSTSEPEGTVIDGLEDESEAEDENASGAIGILDDDDDRLTKTTPSVGQVSKSDDG